MILIIGNVVFVEMSANNNWIKDAKPKFMAGTIGGQLFQGEIYTEEEIRSKYPDVKEAKSFTDIKQVWEGR